jgi:hypothetical protein
MMGSQKGVVTCYAVTPQATIVVSGVVHLMEVRQQGWSYPQP